MSSLDFIIIFKIEAKNADMAGKWRGV